MQQPRKWWVGLPILAGIIYFAADSLTREIEIHIARRAALELAHVQGALDGANVVAEGRDIAVSGVALSEDGRDQALLGVGKLDGVRAALDRTKLVGLAQPFVLTLQRNGSRVTLEGNMPVNGERDRLRAELASLRLEVLDHTSYANGAPSVFLDLARFASQRLAEMDPGVATLTDDAISLQGDARPDADLEKLVASAKSPPTGARVDRLDIKPPRVSPYIWSASRKGEMIALEGFIPTGEARARILSSAAGKAAGAAVSDATRIGSGAPQGDFIGAIDVALDKLGKLASGKVALSDAGLTIEGEGRQNVVAATLEADIKAHLPEGFALAKFSVSDGPPSPFSFSASLRNGALTLSGYAPDSGAIEDIRAAARSRIGGGAVTDTLAQAAGAPRNFAQAITASLPTLARLASGELVVSDTSVTLSGQAPFEGAIADIRKRLAAALPQGYASIVELGARTLGTQLQSGESQIAINALLAKSPFSFAGQETSLADPGAATLDGLAQILLRSADVNFDIVGHLGGTGIEEVIREVAKRRAQAVIDRLVDLGVDAGRLTAVGVATEGPNGHAIEIVAK